MRLTGREAVLSWFTLVVAVVAGTWLWGQPRLQEWREFARREAQLRRRERAANRLLAEKPEVEARLEELRKKLPRHPPGKDVTADVLRLIERVARDNNLSLLRRDPEGERSVGELYEMTIRCTWEGDLEALVRFLYALETQDAILDVRKLSVNPSPGRPGRLNGAFTLDCAYSREAQGT